MIQLTALTQSGADPVQLDLLADAQVTFTLAFADPGKPTTRSAPYSSTFTLPFTQRNDAFFGHYYDVNLLTGSYNPHQRATCVISTDGTPVVEGYLQLRSLSLQAKTYEVNVVGAAGDLFTTLGSLTLPELIDEDVSYTPTGATVLQSWDLSEDISGLGDGVVVIPLADYGNASGGRLFFNAGISDGLASEGYLDPALLKPAMQVDYLVRAIMQEAGYELISDFMETADWLKLYVLLGTQEKTPSIAPVHGCKVGLSSSLLLPTPGTAYALIYGDEASPFYDPGNYHDGTAFIAPFTMTGEFRLGLEFNNDGGGVTVYAVIVTVGAQTVFYSQITYDLTPWTGTFTAPMTAGQEMTVRVFRVTPNGFITPDYELLDGPNTYFEFVAYTSAVNVPLSIRRAMPTVSCADWMRDLVQRFNLVITADPQDQTRIRVEPMPDYLQTGTTHDWTRKLDIKGKTVLKPTTELRTKEIVFDDGVDADYFNKWHADNVGVPLGQYAYRSPDELVQGEARNQSVHGAWAIYPLTNSTGENSDVPWVVIPHLYGVTDTGEAEAVTTRPKLMFYNELVEDAFPQDIYLGSQATRDYPHFSPFSTRAITSTTWSVYWRHTHQFTQAIVGDLYAQGLFGKFWASYMADIYADEARLLQGSFILGAEDIRSLDFADIIRVQNGTYRVIDISGYNPDRQGPCDVRLLKIVDPDTVTLYPSRCTLNLVAQAVDGTTTWEDPDGDPVTPTRECCEAEGFTFQDGVCWWRFPHNAGGDMVMPGTLVGGRPTLPPIATTDGLISNLNPTRYPFVSGASFQLTSDRRTFTAGGALRALLTCTTYNADPQVCTPYGEDTSELYLQPDLYAQLRIRAVGMDVAGSGFTPGDYRMVEQVALVTNFGGILRVPQDHEIRHYKSAGLSQPRVEVGSGAGHGAASGLSNLVKITVESGDDRITSWLVEVDMLVIDVAGFNEATEGLLCEDGQLFSFNNTTLWQTERNL